MKKYCFLFIVFLLQCFLFAEKSIGIQDILDELNFVRTNPKGYIRVLKEHLKTFDGMVYMDEAGTLVSSFEGVQVVYECIDVLKNTSPMQALTMNNSLCRASLWFAKDVAYYDGQGYNGSDGSSSSDRAKRNGFIGKYITEMLSYGRFTARDIVLGLLINDGLKDRPNRKIILNKYIDQIGIGVAFGHSEWDSVIVLNLGTSFNSRNYKVPTSQQILDELNFVRTNPKGYVKFLKEHLKTFNGMTYVDDEGFQTTSHEGVRAVNECIKVLENTLPMQALTINEALTSSALWFAKDSAIHSIVGHVGSDGSSVRDRTYRAGFSGAVGEICDYGEFSARRHVMRFLIDDGVPSRGHRTNILNSKFSQVGIGLSLESDDFGTVLVADFGN